MVATPGTIPALTQYQPDALPLAGTEAVEIVNTTNATAAASYFMLLTDIVGKVPSVLLDTNPTINDRFAFTQMATGLPRSCTLGNFGVPFGNVPTGGAAGTILVKNSAADFDASFTTTIDGEFRQIDGFAYLGGFNSQAYPDTGIGAAFSWNFTGGSAEVDIWNIFTAGGGGARSFLFKQMTGVGAASTVATIWATGRVDANTFSAGTFTGGATQLELQEDASAGGNGAAQVHFDRTEDDTPVSGEEAQINIGHHRTGGTGTRVQVQAQIDTSVGGVGQDIVGWNGLAYAKKVGAAYVLGAFGGIFAVRVDPALPSVNACAIEADTMMLGDVARKIALQVVDEVGSVGQGTNYDAGIVIGKQAGSRGYNYGVQFGFNPGSSADEINNAFLYCPVGTIPYGFDFSGVTFSTAAWKGNFTSTGKIGYAVGSGGQVTQLTNKSTAVTINTVCGQIITNSATLNANTSVAFTVNNTQHAADDVIVLSIKGEATPGSYLVQACAIAANSFAIHIRNITAGNLSEALSINFAIIKCVVS